MTLSAKLQRCQYVFTLSLLQLQIHVNKTGFIISNINGRFIYKQLIDNCKFRKNCYNVVVSLQKTNIEMRI